MTLRCQPGGGAGTGLRGAWRTRTSVGVVRTEPSLPRQPSSVTKGPVSPASTYSQFRLVIQGPPLADLGRASRSPRPLPASSPSERGQGRWGSIGIHPATQRSRGGSRGERGTLSGVESIGSCLPGPAGQEERRLDTEEGSRWVITCATPVTNSGTPSDVSIFSQRHRMVITSRDSLRSSQGVGRGRDRKG